MWRGDFTFEVLMKSWEWGDDKQSWLYAVHGACCTRCMLYTVYAVLGVCRTRCVLHLAYAAPGVNSWWWHGEIERYDLTLCSCNDGRVVDEIESDGGWRWERYGGYERTWEIRVMTCLIGFRRPRIGVITCRIGTHTCCIRDGILTRTRNSLKSQFLMMISPIFSDLSLSCAQLYHHLRTWSQVIPLYLSMPLSWLHTEYSILQVLHHPTIDSLLLQPSLPPLGGCCCTQLSTFWQLQVNKWIESRLPSRLPPNRPLACTPPIPLDHSLQVHPQTRSIPASLCISGFTQSRSPSASLSSLDPGLQLHHWTRLITASKYIVNERGREDGDTGVMEVDWATGCTYSRDPGVDRHHLILISSYHTTQIHTLSCPTFDLTRSFRDARNCVASHGWVVSYLFTFFLGSLS